MKINIGIIGYGLSGSVFHAPLINHLDGLNLKAIVTSNKERKKHIGKLYPNTKVFKKSKSLFEDENIDCVVISVPNRFHFNLAKKALNNNKHVIIEKPFTPTVKEANKLIKIAKSKNLLLTVYHNRRFDCDFLTIKNLIKNNTLGDIKIFESHFDRFKPNVKINRWKEKAKPGAGSLYDLGSHLIDQALVLFGMPDKVFADLRKERAQAKTIDAFDITLFYNNLRVFLKSGSLIKDNELRFIINGSKGSYKKNGLDPQEATLRKNYKITNDLGIESNENYGILTTNKEVKTVKSENGNYLLFYKNFINAYHKYEKLEVTPKQARNVIKIIEKSKLSDKKEKIIKL
ncbi:MAG: Gfo/Idh/MocA family oxidoreductase [Bacillota bacterium]